MGDGSRLRRGASLGCVPGTADPDFWQSDRCHYADCCRAYSGKLLKMMMVMTDAVHLPCAHTLDPAECKNLMFEM